MRENHPLPNLPPDGEGDSCTLVLLQPNNMTPLPLMGRARVGVVQK